MISGWTPRQERLGGQLVSWTKDWGNKTHKESGGPEGPSKGQRSGPAAQSPDPAAAWSTAAGSYGLGRRRGVPEPEIPAEAPKFPFQEELIRCDAALPTF